MARIGRGFPAHIILKQKVGRDYVSSFNESVTPAETFIKSPARAFSESVTLTDNAISALKIIPFSVSDTLSAFVEFFQKATTKNISESITPSEVFAYLHAHFLSLTDSVTLTDIFTFSRQYVRTLTDKIPLIEKIYSFLNGVLVTPFLDLYKKQNTNNQDLLQNKGTQYADPDLYH